ncbi:Nn.00g103750.m01.CDS01 [Neocucurbitaria sp. VM-36]
MPAAAPNINARFPQAPYPLTNTTSPVTTTEATTSRSDDETQPGKTETPTFVPTASYVPVQVVPASELPATTTIHASIPRYEGSGAVILKGYCTEPGYTILDGPTALWVPVVGCISSKAECCPTSTIDGGASAASTQNNDLNASAAPSVAAGAVGSAAFPISSLPSQGSLTGCPRDYHTVEGSAGPACCPSSYWLWSTQLGGQVPCYSSLGQTLVPPPMPDTFIDIGRMTATGSITAAPSWRLTAQTMQQKPTSAIVNIAYAMQYQLAPETETALNMKTKIGIGIGVAGAAILILAVLSFFIRRCVEQKKAKRGIVETTSASQRFGSQVDMSRVAHESPGVTRTYGSTKYAGASTIPVEY